MIGILDGVKLPFFPTIGSKWRPGQVARGTLEDHRATLGTPGLCYDRSSSILHPQHRSPTDTSSAMLSASITLRRLLEGVAEVPGRGMRDMKHCDFGGEGVVYLFVPSSASLKKFFASTRAVHHHRWPPTPSCRSEITARAT